MLTAAKAGDWHLHCQFPSSSSITPCDEYDYRCSHSTAGTEDHRSASGSCATQACHILQHTFLFLGSSHGASSLNSFWLALSCLCCFRHSRCTDTACRERLRSRIANGADNLAAIVIIFSGRLRAYRACCSRSGSAGMGYCAKRSDYSGLQAIRQRGVGVAGEFRHWHQQRGSCQLDRKPVAVQLQGYHKHSGGLSPRFCLACQAASQHPQGSTALAYSS